MSIEIVAISDVGVVRTNNEDNVYCNGIWREDTNLNHFEYMDKNDTDNIRIYAVMDGMGGLKDGEYASLKAAECLHEQCKTGNTENLSELLRSINTEICEEIQKRKVNMGTTMALVKISSERVEFANIGDSRGYLLHDNELIQMSVDHTAKRGMMSISDDLGIENLSFSGMNNGLTQYLGVDEEEFVIEPEVSNCLTFQTGDEILLCSDGLSSYMENDRIKEILCKKNNLFDKAKEFVKIAINRGSSDNITVIIIQCK